MNFFNAVLTKCDPGGEVWHLHIRMGHILFNICAFCHWCASKARKHCLSQTSPCICHRKRCTALPVLCFHNLSACVLNSGVQSRNFSSRNGGSSWVLREQREDGLACMSTHNRDLSMLASSVLHKLICTDNIQ